MKHVFLLVCILILTLTVGVSGAPVQVTTDRSDQIAPAIDGDRIVWVDGRDGGADIYLYDIVGATETRITNGTAVALWPDVSGSRIVWQDNRSGARISGCMIRRPGMRPGSRTPPAARSCRRSTAIQSSGSTTGPGLRAASTR